MMVRSRVGAFGAALISLTTASGRPGQVDFRPRVRGNPVGEACRELLTSSTVASQVVARASDPLGATR